MNKNQQKVTLYIATHNKTGLKYFGKTIRYFTEEDLQRYYHGSGTYWKSHLRKHGNNVTMKIYGIYTLVDVREIALAFSKDQDIVYRLNESGDRKGKKVWANNEIEDGLSGFNALTTTKGMMCVLDTRDDKTKQVSVEDYKLKAYYITPTSKTVTVKHKNSYIDISIEDYNKGNYKTPSSGMVTCIDTKTQKIHRVSKIEFDSSPNLQNVMKNKIPVIDIRTNVKRNVTRDEYNEKSYFVSPTTFAPIAYVNLKTNERGLCTKKQFEENLDYVSPVSKWYYELYNSDNELVETIFRRSRVSEYSSVTNAAIKALRVNRILYDNITNKKNKKYRYKGWFVKN